MTSKLRLAAIFAAASVAGIVAGQLVCASSLCRDAIGRCCGRGRLMALVDRSGIYESDVDRAVAESQDGGEGRDSETVAPGILQKRILSQLIANADATSLARSERISPEAINNQLPPQVWNTRRWAAGWSMWFLRGDVLRSARAQSWIERNMAASFQIEEKECLEYYKTHLDSYVQPPRLRASHIFFAAPPETAPEVVEVKRVAAQGVSDRLAHGEQFADLVALSEDEASKRRGGDLDFFSESRMPVDFWVALRDLHVGEISGVIRTRLGFHVVQLADSLPRRQMTLDDARPEITLALQNRKRSAALGKLAGTLGERAEFIRSEPAP